VVGPAPGARCGGGSRAVERPELVAGALAAAAATAASRAVASCGLASQRPRAAWLAQGLRLGKLAFTDTWAILMVLAKHLAGIERAKSLVRAVRFDVGADEDPAAQARRALAIAYTTATPGTVVLGIDGDAGVMLFHQLDWGDVPEMTVRLGARP
jgi:multisubunit Na+/H+ antiporter MnhE subunit